MAIKRVEPEPEKDALLSRLRRRWPALDHVFRASDAFSARCGEHYAAVITYFSVLSVIPVLMVAFAVIGLVIGRDRLVINQISEGIDRSVPPGLNDVVNDIVDTATRSAGGLGLVGLALALYAGVGWMSNLRDALTAQWGQKNKQVPIVTKTLKDLAALVSVGVALLVSFALMAVGGGLGRMLLELAGLEGRSWTALLRVTTLLLSLVANMLVFLGVIAWLPREKVAMRSATTGAAIASIGFVLLQQLARYYLAWVSQEPAFAVFGKAPG